MRRVVAALLIVAVLEVLSGAAAADEVVETTDGRRVLLRSDGIYELLSKIDPRVIAAALATAREWADDQTLIAYCFRASPEREIMARVFVKDRDEALARLRRAGAIDEQLRLVATTIAEHYRAAGPSDDDKAKTDACTAQDVERNVFILAGSGRPLLIRPPFNELK